MIVTRLVRIEAGLAYHAEAHQFSLVYLIRDAQYAIDAGDIRAAIA